MNNTFLDSAIQSFVGKQKIKFLVHFTQGENLKSIFQHGLVPINQFHDKGISAKTNDLLRLDYCDGATSTSISFPNYKLFYKFQQQDKQIDWAVLGLHPEILWEKKCAFCSDNAANGRIAQIEIEDRVKFEAFKDMYKEIPGKPSRRSLQLPNDYPTNPQAEVLVFGKIEPKYILGVAFSTKNCLNKFQDFIPSDIVKVVHTDFFNARMDYRHW